jgi:DNA-binding NarL/FixJ family response regulator
MDVVMPDLNGVDATRQIAADPGAARVLCLSMHTENNIIGSMLRAGASGYLIKSCAARELVDAIRTVATGKTYVSPMIAESVVQTGGRRGSPSGSHLRGTCPQERPSFLPGRKRVLQSGGHLPPG